MFVVNNVTENKRLTSSTRSTVVSFFGAGALKRFSSRAAAWSGVAFWSVSFYNRTRAHIDRKCYITIMRKEFLNDRKGRQHTDLQYLYISLVRVCHFHAIDFNEAEVRDLVLFSGLLKGPDHLMYCGSFTSTRNTWDIHTPAKAKLIVLPFLLFTDMS